MRVSRCPASGLARRTAEITAPEQPTCASAGPPCGASAGLSAGAIEGYELHGEIHRGRQAAVYRATQRASGQQVALKVLLEGPFASETARRRFRREIELTASLQHPGIVAILDSGISRRRCHFAMQYIGGLRLDRARERLRLPLRPTLELLAELCAAVSFAHRHGVIHRDLKPANILGDRAGRPHVLDFGPAKAPLAADAQQSTLPALSLTGQVLGTLACMSPEQASGSQRLDVRSDVCSLGVIMYEALLGRPPCPTGDPLADALNRIARDQPAPPRALRRRSRFGRAIDDELATILHIALQKDPARRYQSAAELHRDLCHYLKGEPIEARRASGRITAWLHAPAAVATLSVADDAALVTAGAGWAALWPPHALRASASVTLPADLRPPAVFGLPEERCLLVLGRRQARRGQPLADRRPGGTGAPAGRGQRAFRPAAGARPPAAPGPAGDACHPRARKLSSRARPGESTGDGLQVAAGSARAAPGALARRCRVLRRREASRPRQ